MIRKVFLLIGLNRRNFLKYFEYVKENEFRKFDELKKYQEQMLRKIIHFSYNNVPYYYNIFKKNNLNPVDFQHINDLQKLPILTKEIIRENQKDFIPTTLKKHGYLKRSTGGSTGIPLQYRLSRNDEVLGRAIQFANRGYAGYKLGDKFAMIAGSSLIPSTRSEIRRRIREYLMNTRNFSSFDLNEKYMKEIVAKLKRFKPDYIKGYASSIHLFATYLRDKNIVLDFPIKGIFTTAEVIFDSQRKTIENTFDCKVFDQYGLNDGGVSAYECEMHNGLHIDMIRSILEVVDKEGNQLTEEKEGKILATSLQNYAMPFIRYDTGDLGILSDKKCECGRSLPLLNKVIGRTTDYLKLDNGAIIGAPILTVLFGKYDIIQYQIVQKEKDRLLIYIIKGQKYSKNDEKEIRETFNNHVGKIVIEFKYVDKIETTDAGKWKFIIREIED